MKIKRIAVKSSGGNYSVLAGAGALRHANREVSNLGHFSSIQLVSSPTVWRAVGSSVQRGFPLSRNSRVHLMNDAESAKDLRKVEELSRSLVKSGADRGSLLVAIGGGVVG